MVDNVALLSEALSAALIVADKTLIGPVSAFVLLDFYGISAYSRGFKLSCIRLIRGFCLLPVGIFLVIAINSK